MKKFRFRLEPLLQLKDHIEKEKQKKLAAASQKVVKQEQALKTINHERVSQQESQRDFMTGNLNRNLLMMYSRYYLKLKKDEITGREMLKIHLREQEAKRRDLIKATKEKKSFEKLKERLQEKYNKELDLIMQKELDEISTQLFMYKKRLPK